MTPRPMRILDPVRAAGRGALLAFLLLSLSGCALAFRQPTVEIADVRVLSLGLSGGRAGVQVRVDNPNRYDLELRSLSWILEVASPVPQGSEERWARLAGDEEGARALRIPGRDSVVVELPVDFLYAGVGSALRALLLNGEVRYRVQGAIRVQGPIGERRLPFAHRGSFSP